MLFSFTMMRKLSMTGLLWFVIGLLLLPVVHQLELSRPSPVVDCSCHHAESTDDSDTDQPETPRHNPATCPLCQLASMPYESPAPFALCADSERFGLRVVVAPDCPVFQLPRLHPFACGPPVSFCSLHI